VPRRAQEPPPPPACLPACLQIILDEKLAENAAARGEQLRAGLRGIASEFPEVLAEVRGRGLLCAIVVKDGARDGAGHSLSALDLCYGFKNAASHHGCPRGLLAKPTHNTVIRLAPPLVISAAQVDEALESIRTVVRGLVHPRA
jgi:ornithine--oxo-acid transaminase